MSTRDKLPPSTRRHSHPGHFALGSLASRAAARSLAESRESSGYHCPTCVLTGLWAGDESVPEFTPTKDMEMRSDGYYWKCSRHKDPSKEAVVQALIKSGLLRMPGERKS